MAPSKLQFAAATAMLLLLLLVQQGTQQIQAQEQPHRKRAVGHKPSLPVAAARKRPHVVKKMVFYMHDIPTAPNATAAVVAAQGGKLTPPFKLGVTFVFDDKLTEGPDPNSKELGRGRGLYSLASLSDADLLLVFTAVFHSPAKYNGSTICFHGSDSIFLPEREIGVVGGTGYFRFARGYAILSTAQLKGNGNAVIRFNVTMLL